MSPSVSVLLSSYNHAAFVAEAVESVLAQDFESFELIVRDDGSSDGTQEVLDSYQDARIVKLDLTQNLGGAGSLNYCLQHARGEYVAIMNSDDVWLPKRLSTQMGVMEARPDLGAVFSFTETIDSRGKPLQAGDHFYGAIFEQENRERHEWLRHFFQKGNCLCHPSALIRRAVYEQVGDYDVLMDQLPDFDMWVRLCARYPIHVHQEPLLRFRVLDHEANASGDNAANRDRTAYELIKVLKHYAQPLLMEQLHEIFPEWVKPEDGRSDRLRGLANAALAVASSPHHFFALDRLRELAEAGSEKSLAEKSRVRKLGRSARPFAMVHARPVRCRIKVRSGDESFSAKHPIIRVLDAGVASSDSVELPTETEQVRLEIDGGYTSMQVIELSLKDANGVTLWDAGESMSKPMKVSGAQPLEVLEGGDDTLRYASTGRTTKLTLPRVAGAGGMVLCYGLRVEYDHDELLRRNELLSRRVKELEGGNQQPDKPERNWPNWLRRMTGSDPASPS